MRTMRRNLIIKLSQRGKQYGFIHFFIILFFLFSHTNTVAQEEKAEDSLPKWNIGYSSKGFELKSSDNLYKLQIQSRLQFRFATPDDQDPITFDDYDEDGTHLFKINRARLKVGGNAYKTWLKYYWEYDMVNSNLLDFRVMVEKWKWLSLKFGQWKLEYSRERRISSGEQQLVDRSIINRPFTVDRQQGVELYGRLDGKSLLDFSYWAAVLTGTGRGNNSNDDGHFMYFGRLQWNPLGEDMGFESSDMDHHGKPAAIIAIAGVTNRSPYTRFSSSGGGELLGFEDAENGQYRVEQYNLETAFVYKGITWQSEWHHKKIIDMHNDVPDRLLKGYYLQAGYYPQGDIPWWPKPLEIAARYSSYIPDSYLDQDHQDELSCALNWFFRGHKNKLTAEVSHFDYEQFDRQVDRKWRFRVQWEVSF